MSHWPAAMKITLQEKAVISITIFEWRRVVKGKWRALIQSSEQQFALVCPFHFWNETLTLCPLWACLRSTHTHTQLRINQTRFWAMLRPNIHDTLGDTEAHDKWSIDAADSEDEHTHTPCFFGALGETPDKDDYAIWLFISCSDCNNVSDYN